MKTSKWVNAAAYAAMILVNALANFLRLGGVTTGEVSAAYPNLFTPAGAAFAIWGLIYLLLGMFVLYQWGVFDSGAASTALREDIGAWFAVLCACNILWVVCWHLKWIGLSTLMIFLMLGSLEMVERRIRTIRDGIAQRVLVNAGFDFYYGWVIAASIANVSVWLVKLGWKGWGLEEQFWTALMLLVGAAIGCAVVLLAGRRLSGASVIWAYAGILLRHMTTLKGQYPYAIGAAVIGIAAIAAAISMRTGAEREITASGA